MNERKQKPVLPELVVSELVVSDAARRLGQVRTEAKAAASRKNGKAGGRPVGSVKPLSEIACTCGRESAPHQSGCAVSRAIRYRKTKGLPLV